MRSEAITTLPHSIGIELADKNGVHIYKEMIPKSQTINNKFDEKNEPTCLTDVNGKTIGKETFALRNQGGNSSSTEGCLDTRIF